MTGASAGLGYEMLLYLLEQGNKVVATVRNPKSISDLAQKYDGEQLLVLKLDVTSKSDIKTAFAQAVDKFGRIDVVYSNAGMASLGEIESTPDETARRMFDVNFWGSVNVAREAFNVFRDVNKPHGGRFLQTSSVNGLAPVIGLGFYSSTYVYLYTFLLVTRFHLILFSRKHAIEGVMQSLSNELHPSWNIKITLLELGLFKTRAMGAGGMGVVTVHPAYDREDVPTAGVRKFFETGLAEAAGADPSKASREIYKIAVDDTVPLRVPIGVDALKNIVNQLDSLREAISAAEKWSVDLSFDT